MEEEELVENLVNCKLDIIEFGFDEPSSKK